ncbi:MAG: hypothetical protein FD157_1103 [Rhodocyclaceae bacterium]|nr:MAG: hypothetical protein FD157_1103 [Rhodocyclaceae bacterium]TND06129.1 MAG: hypothetical protein FD118_201 [Rhodocyclaceae bacterium]
MWQRQLLRFLVALSAIASVGGFLWMTFAPPSGMKTTRDGVPYFTPPVVHPVTGQPVSVETLVQHYKGGK